MKELLIIGAGGNGKVISDIAKLNGYENISFLDDNAENKECCGYPVLGSCSQFLDYNCDMIVSIGNSKIRQIFIEKLEKANKNIVSLIHPNVVIGSNVNIGIGTVIMAGVVINSSTTIGKGCIINTSSSLDHDNIIKDYVHISPGAHTSGTVSIGDRTWIGTGAVVINNINICSDCIIGAGAVVTKDILVSDTYVGIPAKGLKK